MGSIAIDSGGDCIACKLGQAPPHPTHPTTKPSSKARSSAASPVPVMHLAAWFISPVFIFLPFAPTPLPLPCTLACTRTIMSRSENTKNTTQRWWRGLRST